MITYLRMSSAWHKGDGPAQVPRSLVGDGEVAAGARVSWTCLDTRSGPTWPWPPGKNASLVKERGSGFCAGVRWRVAGQSVDVREQHPPRRPTLIGDGLGKEPGADCMELLATGVWGVWSSTTGMGSRRC